ncbi:tRNA pseudouridine(55) synthase TruB [bacterium]|nr:tRNA pseudouridine(55) synthase TruB [bacterium]
MQPLHESDGSFNFAEGELLLIDKPLDWTSFDAVNKIKSLLRNKYKKQIKVGHAGTLDPRATGLLIICTGKKTKLLAGLQGMDKVYTGEIELGATTPTYDTESEIDERFGIEHITPELIEQTLPKFKGFLEQYPPAHSAVWVDGKRAYELARKGKEVEMKPRSIRIFYVEVIDYSAPILRFEAKVSKGTYIRSLAYDLGKALNSGGYLKTLRRTKIGEYSVADALTLEQFEFMVKHS